MSYLDDLADRLGNEEPHVIIWELDEAFEEASRESPDTLSPQARAMRELVRFCNCDSIAPWLRDEREAVQRARQFAERIGEAEVAEILAEALDGKPQAKATFSVSFPGVKSAPLDIETPEACFYDGKDWSGTDMALSFAMDGFTEAVLQEVLAARNTIALEAPRAVRARESAEKTVGDAVAAGETAASLFRKIVTARNPRVVAGPWEDAEVRRVDRARRVPVTHVAYSPAPASLLKSISGKYGAVADELLAVYAIHNGAELFMAEGEAGFCLVPIEHWGEMLAHAMEWAEDVTWQDEEEEIPSYLRSAIAFGLIPGDHERWILVTEGPHAGTVMLSDTDVIDDEPRFRTLADFFGTLLLDSARILNSGGHVRYGPDDQEVFPIRYEFD